MRNIAINSEEMLNWLGGNFKTFKTISVFLESVPQKGILSTCHEIQTLLNFIIPLIWRVKLNSIKVFDRVEERRKLYINSRELNGWRKFKDGTTAWVLKINLTSVLINCIQHNCQYFLNLHVGIFKSNN